MTIVGIIIWSTPICMVLGGFFTSAIKAHRYFRCLTYLVILFWAFLFNLQSTSFKNDVADFAFSQAVLLVCADLFWRMVRRRNRLIRISGVVLGCTCMGLMYGNWIIDGPSSIMQVKRECRLSERKVSAKIYFVKNEWSPRHKKGEPGALLLLKSSALSPIEQRLDRFVLPQGYEAARLSFSWDSGGVPISVQVVGDNDTLWTLSEPMPQQ